MKDEVGHLVFHTASDSDLGSPSLIVLMVSVDVKQHLNVGCHRAQKLCESRGGPPGLPSLVVLMVSVEWT